MDPPEHVNMKFDLVIQPELMPMFEEIATNTGIEFTVSTNDLQEWIDAEKSLKKRKAGLLLDQYNELDEINQFLDDMEQAYPTRAEVFTIGESYEGRTIKGIKITTNESNPGIFIEANIHSREWISSATAIWIINEVLTTTNTRFGAVADSVTWYILPVLNVDGLFKKFVSFKFS